MTLLSAEDRAQIQGIVTTGFGHLTCAAFVFARVDRPTAARAWLRERIDEVTTAEPWAENEVQEKIRPTATLNIAFTYPGLELLGLPEQTCATFPTEFAVGMTARAAVLGDRAESAPETWELGGPSNPPLHVLLVVYADGEETLDRRLADLRGSLAGGGLEEIRIEQGARTDRSREHFGFASDGISQPLIEGVRKEDVPGTWVMRTGEFLLGHLNELGLYPPSPAVAVADDPGGLLPPFPEGALEQYRDFGRNGSYFVYRKLHQEVAGFWRFLQERVGAPSGDESPEHAMTAAAAKLMGRWPSGAPLVLAPDADEPELATANRFMYRQLDEVGDRCPVGSHIRRANPRDSIKKIADPAEESIRTSNLHRIMRRGIPYGPPLFPPERIEDGHAPLDLEDDGEARGLHFFCVNADTKRQFEFVQQTWLNNPKFDGLYATKDPIVGDNDGNGHMKIPRRPVRSTLNGIPRFVTVRGGAYLFLPSIAALRFLTREPG